MSYLDTEKNFFGRKAELDLLRRRVIALKEGYRQNVSLLGAPYVGKSSLLKNFLQNLDDPDLVVIYLDLEHKDFQYFYSKFTLSLLYNYSKSAKLSLHEDFNLLVESVRGHIPHTIQVIQRIRDDFSKGKAGAAYLGLLALPEVFTNETGKFCVLILDEFQVIEEFGLPDAFLDLGKKIMTQKKCFYVLSSSYPSAAQKIISERLSLLFGNFENINVEPFDLQTSQEFIEHSLKGVKMGATLRNFLTDFTGGHPLYLNLICKEIIHLSAVHKQQEAYMPIVSQAVENTLFDRWGVISRHFELIVMDLCQSKGNKMLSLILMALANGYHKIDAIAKDTGLRKSQVSQKMQRLFEQGFVTKNGSFHYYKDRLFKYWIKFIYQRRLKDPELTPDKRRKEYKEEFNACVESFQADSRKDFTSRIIELLHCFDNESFDINGRRYRLPVFDEVVPFKVRGEGNQHCDVLKATAGGSVWFIIVKKDNIGENDVMISLKEARKIAQKPERCLLVSMSQLDDHTRLKALQEKFWIWNQGELNTLLNLYDKPFIV